jgi:hypothetical protein
MYGLLNLYLVKSGRLYHWVYQIYHSYPFLAQPETADLPMLEMAVQKASGAA